MPYPPLKKETYNSSGGINQKISLYIAQEGEYLNLQNVDFRTVGALSTFAGTTNTYLGYTSIVNGIALYYYVPGNTFAPIVNTAQIVSTDSYNVAAPVTSAFPQVLLPYIISPNSIQNAFALGPSALFGCNGSDFWRYKGDTAWQFSLGKPYLGASNPFYSMGNGGLSGVLTMFWSLVRADGFIGPALAVTYGGLTGSTAVLVDIPYGPNLNVGSGLSLGSFGVSGIQAWAQLNLNLPVGLSALFGFTTSGAAQYTLTQGFTGTWLETTPQPLDFQGSFLYGLGENQGSDGANYPIPLANPQCIEFFYNQLFSSKHNTVIFSDPGTPEQADYENSFEVAIEDPNDLSAMKTYFTNLMIFKPRSTWVLNGTGPDTFVLSQVSNGYGCLNKNSVVVWNNVCWYLDEKGIIEFNGSNVQCVSNKLEPIFETMNISAATSSAIMTHVKDRNEIWCAIPINGSTINNIIVVYDYISNAWTTRVLPTFAGPYALASIIAPYTNMVTYASIGAEIIQFGNSLTIDAASGLGLTQIIQSRFIEGDMGNSITKVFRRLYVDAAIPTGMTFPITVNMFADKATLPTYSTTMGLSAYQTRIDFGIPAKSLSVQFIYSGMTFLRFNGFTVEFRFQRAT